jgi:hypothetical protein
MRGRLLCFDLKLTPSACSSLEQEYAILCQRKVNYFYLFTFRMVSGKIAPSASEITAGPGFGRAFQTT